MIDEYRQSSENFPEPLPDGITFPSDIPKTYDATYQSEPGVGESIAHFYWICAWQKAFIDAFVAGDREAQSAALNALERWKTTDFYANHFDDPQDRWTKNMLTPARKGNPKELIEGYENGCNYYLENNP